MANLTPSGAACFHAGFTLAREAGKWLEITLSNVRAGHPEWAKNDTLHLVRYALAAHSILMRDTSSGVPPSHPYQRERTLRIVADGVRDGARDFRGQVSRSDRRNVA